MDAPVLTHSLQTSEGTKTIEIHNDFDPANPCEEWDMFGTIRFYKLGFGHEKGDLDEIFEDDNLLSLPIYAYDHGGMTISTKPFGCPWDSGLAGVIYVRKDHPDFDTEAAASVLLGTEVRLLDQWLTGQVYGFIMYEGDEETDSCWGFYGSPEEVLQQVIDDYIGGTK